MHVNAQFEMIEDPRTAFAAMAEMVKHFEAHYRTGWTLPHGESAIEDLMRGIVVFRLRELAYDAKFKMSQKF